MTNYQIIQKSTLDALVTCVRLEIVKGWRVNGVPFYLPHVDIYCQLMHFPEHGGKE